MTASAGFFLSPQQKHTWTSAASARSQIVISIEGPLDEPRLLAALLQVVKTNEALRTVFQRQTGMRMPFQIVLDDCPPAWSSNPSNIFSANLSPDVQQCAHDEALQAMPAESSQLRSALFTSAEARTLWILTAHSAVADAKSMQLLLAATVREYLVLSQNETEPLRYVQFAQWQNDLLAESDDAAKDAGKFWAAQTAVQPALPGETSGSQTAPSASRLDIALDGELSGLAESIGDNVTSSDIVLAAWSAVIARISGHQTVELGLVLEGREYEELATMLGPVSKIVPLVASLKDLPTFSELVLQIHAQRNEMATMQEYYSPDRLFNVGYEHTTLENIVTASGTTFSTLSVHDSTHDCAIKLRACSGPAGLRLQLQYQPQVFSDSAAAEIAETLKSFLSAAVQQPRQSVNTLPIVSSAVKTQLLTYGRGSVVSVPFVSMSSLIVAQALRTPGAEAVRSGADVVTYGELDGGSNRLGHYLLKLGVKRGSLVGLCVSRSAAMMVPVLAILKAGGAYVALDAEQPKARTAQQMEGVEVLLTEAALMDKLPEFGGQIVVLDGANRPWEEETEAALEGEAGSDDLAYVIYTSGSTGRPKGVGVRHGNLVNYALHMVRSLGLDERPLQYATVSTMSADLGNTVIYPALLTGGCLHVLPYEVATDSHHMSAYQAQYKIDVLKIVPSHLAALLESGGTAVLPNKYLITGGEALRPALVERILGSETTTCELINHYGPTETTVGSLMLPLKEYDWKHSPSATVPIGRPIANTRVYVLDPHQQLVPVGVAGELYIGGAGVTAGYINQPEMTAERFVADPFTPGERMYRTGDLVRWVAGDLVEFLGRTDDQVKIRGFRVELGEIETVLAAQPGVRQCVVMARAKQGTPDDRQIVAYVVLDRQQGTTSEALKLALRERLPDHMVPAAIVELQKLPLTANGKVDRAALPAPEERSARIFKAPAGATEELVAQIWEQVLKVQNISTDENFFDLGGHSLMATQVISRIRETFKLEIPLRTMFESAILFDFAAAVDKVKATGAVAAASAPIRRAVRREYRSATPS